MSDAIIHITCKPVARKSARATGLRFVFEQLTKINKQNCNNFIYLSDIVPYLPTGELVNPMYRI